MRIVIPIAATFMLTACTTTGYNSEKREEWWPNGKHKTSVVRRNIHAEHLSNDAPKVAGDLLDMGSDFATKHLSTILGTALSTMLVGGGISGVQRRSAKRERDALRLKNEKDKADEYAAGVLAGKSGGSV